MSKEMMQAVYINEYGDAGVLKVGQVEKPVPQAGQVLVRIKAAGVNPVDWKIRAGYLKDFFPLPMPWIPGSEAAGTVEALGAGVTGLKKGDAVFGAIGNSYAEYAVIEASELCLKPAHVSFEGAASIAHGGLTAWQAVIEEAEVKEGQHVLVHGGAGGVGLFAVQLAHWKGAHVSATASAANADYLHSLGVETVIDYNTTKFEDVVKDVDAVIDTVGGDLEVRSLHVIRRGGIFVTVAAFAVNPEAGELKNIRLTAARRADTAKLKELGELAEAKKIIPVVGKTFPLAQVKQAHELSQTGHGRGRIVLTVG